MYRHCDNKLRTYSIYKEKFALEPYTLQGPVRIRRNITKLRISAHSLAVETGRYTRPKTLRVNRTCHLCNNIEIEDEFHMFLRCPFYNDERSHLFKSLSDFSTVNWDPNLSTFKILMNVGNGDYEFFKPVSTFINECFEKRKSVPTHWFYLAITMSTYPVLSLTRHILTCNLSHFFVFKVACYNVSISSLLCACPVSSPVALVLLMLM